MKGKMETTRVELGDRSYDIAIGSGTLAVVGEAVRALEPGDRVALVTNPTVEVLYADAVVGSLREAGLEVLTVTIPDGEEHKSLKSLEHILTELLRARLDRGSVLVALGGGVVGDITGFAASAYMRGIRFAQVPTTLLAQVDSSVGGKTGVNHPLGKNMIGAFWQPSLVWVDVDTLRTLPRRELLAGLSEVIKYGVIWDANLFDYLVRNREEILLLDAESLMHIVRRSCEIKAEVVARDEREAGLRSILNYGHTIGHAIESVTAYKRFLHGEAIAIGMALEAELSRDLGLMPEEDAARVKSILDAYGLPSALPDDLEVGALIEAMALDKKALAGKLRFTLPEKIGSTKLLVEVGREKIVRALAP
jgi:3-dehydroquinate synthase